MPPPVKTEHPQHLSMLFHRIEPDYDIFCHVFIDIFQPKPLQFRQVVKNGTNEEGMTFVRSILNRLTLHMEINGPDGASSLSLGTANPSSQRTSNISCDSCFQPRLPVRGSCQW